MRKAKSPKDPEDRFSRNFKLGFTGFAYIVAIVMSLEILSYNSLKRVEVEIQSITLQVKHEDNFFHYVHIQAKEFSERLSVNGNRTEMEKLHSELINKIKLPARVTLLVTPAILLGEFGKVVGIQHQGVFLLDPGKHIGSRRFSEGILCLAIFGIAIVSTIVIYKGGEWPWEDPGI